MSTSMTATQFPGLVSGTWVIDPSHSDVTFTVRHIVSKVRGQFTSFEGSLTIADDPFASQAQVSIDMSSIDTRNNDRDNHLRSSDFFSVETHPTMTFASTAARDAGGHLVLEGDLTLKDVTKPVELALEFLGVGSDPWGATRVGFEATTTLSRKDWGVDFNIPLDGGKVVIGDRINVAITIEAVHQA